MTTVSDTHLVNRERVQPDDTNNYDSAHGGNVMKWMDEIGAMSAMRHAGKTCVTAHVARLNFEQPIPRGETCVVDSYAYAAGRTSVRVRIRAYRENPTTGAREQTTESYFVFVAVDDEMRPTTVPELTVETDRDRELRDAGLSGEPDREGDRT